MKLMVHELVASASQKLRAEKNTMVSAVRPHIYIHNKPVGTLKVQIWTEDGVVLAESNEIDIQSICNLPYFHGYVRFDIKANIRKDTVYNFSVIPGGGYSFDESAYCGVCNDYDLRKYTTDMPVLVPAYAPLDIEVWGLSHK